jgi:hypothetical protein
MKPNRFVAVLLEKLMIFLSMSLFSLNIHAQPLNSWNLVLSNSPVQISSMAYGNGTFVGAGGGLRFVSHDGSNWTTYATPPIINDGADSAFGNGGMAYGNGTFLAFGTNNQYKANFILQSTNGITWAKIYTSSNSLFAAAYGNNTWVFVASAEIVIANVTATNWNWTEYQPSFSPLCITYANGVFVIVANVMNYFSGNQNNSVFSSSDGITWQYESNLPLNDAQPYYNTGIAYGNGVFIASAIINHNPNTPEILISSNLVNWSSAYNLGNPSDGPSFPVIFGGNQFIAAQNHYLFTSADGYTWNNIFTNDNSDFSALTYGQGAFVAADYSGNIYQSGMFATNSNSFYTTLGISTYPGVTINGTAGAVYQIQCSTNLNNWQTITNFMLPSSPYIWVDTSSTVTGQKFYRSVQLQ